MTRLEELREKRDNARKRINEIAAAYDGSRSDADEVARLDEIVEKTSQQIIELQDQELRELRAAPAFRGNRQLSKDDLEIARALRSAIEVMSYGGRFQPIEIAPELPEKWPEDKLPYQPQGMRSEIVTRDTLKTTATQALPTTVYKSFVEHLLEQTSVLRAGGTLVNTDSGEDLVVPKTTAVVSNAALTAEGVGITEGDPTLATVILKAYKYANFFQISTELATDTPTNLLDVLNRSAAKALVLAYGPHLATGTGSGQPNGFITAAGIGKTSAAGGSLSLGVQTTAGLGTDNLIDLYASIAEPYALEPSLGILGTNASLAIAKKLRDGQSRPVLDTTPVKPGSSANLMGVPYYVDPHVAQMAVNALSLAYGAWDRYWVRIAGGVRFERSDEFAFNADLVSFRCIVRLDGNLIDTNAIKTFKNSAT